MVIRLFSISVVRLPCLIVSDCGRQSFIELLGSEPFNLIKVRSVWFLWPEMRLHEHSLGLQSLVLSLLV